MNGKSTCLLSLVVTLSFIAIPARAAGKGQPAGPRKRAVFVPGHQSHGWSGHAYTADCKLLARILNENAPQIEATVLEGGWPKDPKAFEGAAAIVIACDGNSLLGPESNWKALDDLARKVEVPAGGVPTPTRTVQDMEASLEGDRPADWTVERTRETIERVNRQQRAPSHGG